MSYQLIFEISKVGDTGQTLLPQNLCVRWCTYIRASLRHNDDGKGRVKSDRCTLWCVSVHSVSKKSVKRCRTLSALVDLDSRPYSVCTAVLPNVFIKLPLLWNCFIKANRQFITPEFAFKVSYLLDRMISFQSWQHWFCT